MRWGVGGEVFAGYDLSLTPRLLIGAEAAVDFGGRTAARSGPGYLVATAPRHGFSLTMRAGFTPVSRVLLYAGAGYGGHDYHVTESGIVGTADDLS